MLKPLTFREFSAFSRQTQIFKGCPLRLLDKAVQEDHSTPINSKQNPCSTFSFTDTLTDFPQIFFTLHFLDERRFSVVREAFGQVGWCDNVSLRHPKKTLSFSISYRGE